jgi:hypothetical protein
MPIGKGDAGSLGTRGIKDAVLKASLDPKESRDRREQIGTKGKSVILSESSEILDLDPSRRMRHNAHPAWGAK